MNIKRRNLLTTAAAAVGSAIPAQGQPRLPTAIDPACSVSTHSIRFWPGRILSMPDSYDEFFVESPKDNFHEAIEPFFTEIKGEDAKRLDRRNLELELQLKPELLRDLTTNVKAIRAAKGGAILTAYQDMLKKLEHDGNYPASQARKNALQAKPFNPGSKP